MSTFVSGSFLSNLIFNWEKQSIYTLGFSNFGFSFKVLKKTKPEKSIDESEEQIDKDITSGF